MNPAQLKILQELARGVSLSGLSLRKICSLTGISHPYTVKFHLQQLINKGFLDSDRKLLSGGDNFLQIPIYGTANCGIATHIADNVIEGYLPISKDIFKNNNTKGIFALKASGDSMNKASPNINDGDYVLILPTGSASEVGDDDCVVGLFDNQANIKRLKRSGEDMVLFVSDSTRSYPPIVATQQDLDSGSVRIIGKVFRVIPS